MRVTVSRPRVGTSWSAIASARRTLVRFDCRIVELTRARIRAAGLPLLGRTHPLTWVSDLTVVAIGDRVEVEARFDGARRAWLAAIALSTWPLARVALLHPAEYEATSAGLPAWIGIGVFLLPTGSFASWFVMLHVPRDALVWIAENAALGDAPRSDAYDAFLERKFRNLDVMGFGAVYVLGPPALAVGVLRIAWKVQERAGHPLTTAEKLWSFALLWLAFLAAIIGLMALLRRRSRMES